MDLTYIHPAGPVPARERAESLGAAERIIGTLLGHADHLYHGRPGLVTPDRAAVCGAKWQPATARAATPDAPRSVYLQGKPQRRGQAAAQAPAAPVGSVDTTDTDAYGRPAVLDAAGGIIGRMHAPGLFPEMCIWIYDQIATVFELDNEFTARWASWSFGEEHRDLKVALAAFMLVQARCGGPERDPATNAVAFYDVDYRDVGVAMGLLRRRDGRDMNPKMLLRAASMLELDGVAAINRRLGFGRSLRKPFLGRWPSMVESWLRQRERTPGALDAFVKAGWRRTVMSLARKIGYKPESVRFFEALRWKQTQARDGRRSMLDAKIEAADSWAGLDEAGVCEAIVKERPAWKRLVGMLPAGQPLTRAIVCAAVEVGCLRDTDLLILSPTLEELGLLDIEPVKSKHAAALAKATSMRAANVAKRMRTTEHAEALEQAADAALQQQVAEVARDVRIYVGVDISGSMTTCIARAKALLARFLQGFPADRLHVAVFNTSARAVAIPHPSAAGVEAAFRGIHAGGGTSYGAGMLALGAARPPVDGEDAIVLWVGDQLAHEFSQYVGQSGLSPVAFGMLHVAADAPGAGGWQDPMTSRCVERTAATLGIPCFEINEAIFDDPYAIPRTLRRLVEAAPAGPRIGRPAAARKSLVETILATPLLEPPPWA